MNVGDKIPISDISSDIKIDTLKDLIFECKYFKCFTLEKSNGYYKHICKTPANIKEKDEHTLFLDMFHKELNKIK